MLRNIQADAREFVSYKKTCTPRDALLLEALCCYETVSYYEKEVQSSSRDLL